MKKLRSWAACAAACLLALSLLLAGCAGGVYVKDIRPLGDGTYVVEYSDGTTSSFVLQDGKDGADGKDGKDGADGKDGTDGKDGADGKDGEDGKDGADGKDGEDGKDGADGKDGKDGVTVNDLYEEYCALYGEISYEEFLEKFLGKGDVPAEAVSLALLSSVKICAEYYETVELTDGLTQKLTNIFNGAGVIYEIGEEYTYILTNEHIFVNENANEDNGSDRPRRQVCYLYGSENFPEVKQEDGENVQVDGYDVYDYGEYAIECEYVGGAVTQDVALIRAKTSDVLAVNPNVRAATFADDYYVGQSAFTVGNPNQLGLSVTRGIVSIESEYIELSVAGVTRDYRELRMDVPVYSGNSGGGLFNGNGELIGLTNARRPADQNITFAIPLPIAEGTAANIRAFAADGDASTNGALRPVLGVTVTAENKRYEYDPSHGHGHSVEDVTVESTVSGSIAERIGLRAGDVLCALTLGGQTFDLTHIYDVGDALLWARPGTQITLRLRRGGAEIVTDGYTFTAKDFSVVE